MSKTDSESFEVISTYQQPINQSESLTEANSTQLNISEDLSLEFEDGFSQEESNSSQEIIYKKPGKKSFYPRYRSTNQRSFRYGDYYHPADLGFGDSVWDRPRRVHKKPQGKTHQPRQQRQRRLMGTQIRIPSIDRNGK